MSSCMNNTNAWGPKRVGLICRSVSVSVLTLIPRCWRVGLAHGNVNWILCVRGGSGGRFSRA